MVPWHDHWHQIHNYKQLCNSCTQCDNRYGWVWYENYTEELDNTVIIRNQEVPAISKWCVPFTWGQYKRQAIKSLEIRHIWYKGRFFQGDQSTLISCMIKLSHCTMHSNECSLHSLYWLAFPLHHLTHTPWLAQFICADEFVKYFCKESWRGLSHSRVKRS